MPLTPEEQKRLEKLKQNFGGLTPEEARRAREIEKTLENESGFIARLGADLGEREDQAQEIKESFKEGEITSPEYALQMIGKPALGAVGDVVGQTLTSAGRSVAGLDKALTGGMGAKAVKGAVEAVGSLPSYGGGTIGERIPSEVAGIAKDYQEFSEENPRLATNIEAATNVGLGAMGGKPALESIQSLMSAGKKLTKGKIARLDADQLREQGGVLFQQAEEMGGGVTPEFWQEYVKRIQREVSAKSELGERLSAASGDRQSVKKAMNAISADQENPQSLSAIKEADSILGELAESSINNMGRYTKEGKDFIAMRSVLGDMLENAPDELFTGQGFETAKVMREAKKVWAAQARMDDVQRIISKAEGANQPATVMRNGFRRLRDDKKRFNRYTPEEQFAIKKAAKEGALESFLALQGSGLTPIIYGAVGFGTGGAAGSAAGVAGSFATREAAKGLRESIGANKSRGVLDQIQATVGDAPTSVSPDLYRAAISAGQSTLPLGVAQSLKDRPLAERARRIKSKVFKGN